MGVLVEGAQKEGIALDQMEHLGGGELFRALFPHQAIGGGRRAAAEG